jgi:hypothetical protein
MKRGYVLLVELSSKEQVKNQIIGNPNRKNWGIFFRNIRRKLERTVRHTIASYR